MNYGKLVGTTENVFGLRAILSNYYGANFRVAFNNYGYSRIIEVYYDEHTNTITLA